MSSIQVCSLWPKTFSCEKRSALEEQWTKFIHSILSTVKIFQNCNDRDLVVKFKKCMEAMFPEQPDISVDEINAMEMQSEIIQDYNHCLTIVGMNPKSLFTNIEIPVWQWRFFSELLYNIWRTVEFFECGIIYQVDRSTFPFLRLIIDVDYKHKSTETVNVFKSLLGVRRKFIQKMENDIQEFFHEKSTISFLYTSKENKLSFHMYTNIYVDKATYFHLHVYLMNLYRSDENFKIDMVTGISMPFIRNHLIFNVENNSIVTDKGEIDYELWSCFNVFNIYDCWNNIYVLSRNNNINDTLSTTMYLLDSTNQTVNEISELSTNETVTNHTLTHFKESHLIINLKDLIIFLKNSVASSIICKSNTIQKLNFGCVTQSLIHILKEWHIFSMESTKDYAMDVDCDVSNQSLTDSGEKVESNIDQTHFYNIFNYSKKNKKRNFETHIYRSRNNSTSNMESHIPKSVKNIQGNVHFSDSCRFPFSKFQLDLLDTVENNKANNPDIFEFWDVKEKILLEMLSNLNSIDNFYLPTLFLLQPFEIDEIILKVPASLFVKNYYPKQYLNTQMSKNNKNPMIETLQAIITKCIEDEKELYENNIVWYEQRQYVNIFAKIIEGIFNIGNVSAMMACIALNNQTYNHMDDVILFILYNFNLSLHAKYILTKWYEVNINNFREHFIEGTAFNNKDFLLFSVIQLNGIEYKPYEYRGGPSNIVYRLKEKILTYAFMTAKELYSVTINILETNLTRGLNLPTNETVLILQFVDFTYFFITHVLGAKSINDKTVLIFSGGCWKDMTKNTLDGDFPLIKNTNIAPVHSPETSSFCFEWAHCYIGLFNTSFQVFELNNPSWKNRVYIKQPVSSNINGWQLSFAPEINNFLMQTFMGAFHFMKQIHLDVLTVSLLTPILPIEVPNEMSIQKFIKSYNQSSISKKIINKRLDCVLDDLYINIYHKITMEDFSRIPLKIWPLTNVDEVFHFDDNYDPRIVQCWSDNFKSYLIENIHQYPNLKKILTNVITLFYFLKINPIIPIHVLLKKIFCNERKNIDYNLCHGQSHRETFNSIVNDICDTLKTTTSEMKCLENATNSDNVIDDKHFNNSSSLADVENQNVLLTRMEYNVMNTWYYNSIPRIYDSNQELSCFLVDKILKNQINTSHKECQNLIFPSTSSSTTQATGVFGDDNEEPTPINKFHMLIEKFKRCKISTIQEIIKSTLPVKNKQPIAETIVEFDDTMMDNDAYVNVSSTKSNNNAAILMDSDSVSSINNIASDSLSSVDIENYFKSIKQRRKNTLLFQRKQLIEIFNTLRHNTTLDINFIKIEEIFLRLALLFASWIIRMGDDHDFTNCNFFKDIRCNRRKLYVELRNFMYSLNGEPLQYSNSSEYVKRFSYFIDSHDFIVDNQFKKTTLLPYEFDNNIAHKYNTIYPNRYIVEGTLEMETQIVNKLIQIYKNEVYQVFTSYIAFAEYHPHVFTDIIKYLMTSMFKGNVARQYMFIVGVTGCGKSTLIQALQQLFRGQHSCLLHGHAFDKHTKADVLDPSAEKIASSLLCVTDEVINPDCTRLNSLCSDGESSSRAIHANITSQFKISASLILAGNKGFMINDATEDRMFYLHKDFLLSKYLLCHDSYIDEYIISDNCSKKRFERTLTKFKNFTNVDMLKNASESSKQIGEIVTTSNFAGLQFIKRSLPYLYSFPVCGQYITYMYGKLFFYNSFNLPISKDLTRTSMRYKYEFSKANNPVQRFLSTFTIDTNYSGITSRSEFHDIVFGWWNQIKRQCFYQNPGDFNGSSLVTLLEHRLNKYRSPDGGYKFKIILK